MPLRDQDGNEVDELAVELRLDVRRVVVRHAEVSLFDAEGRESILVARPTHPGAGLSVDFADHVEVSP